MRSAKPDTARVVWVESILYYAHAKNRKASKSFCTKRISSLYYLLFISLLLCLHLPAYFNPRLPPLARAMQSINIYENSLQESQRNLDFFVLLVSHVWVYEENAATGVGVLIVEADSFSTSRTVPGQMKKTRGWEPHIDRIIHAAFTRSNNVVHVSISRMLIVF